MHYAFDSWLEREFPVVEFERYADDAVVHCVTERQALQVREALAERMEQVGLRLHPDKPRSCTARTTTGAARMSMSRLCSWGTSSAPAACVTARAARCSRRSRPRSARRR